MLRRWVYSFVSIFLPNYFLSFVLKLSIFPRVSVACCESRGSVRIDVPTIAASLQICGLPF